jgi:hypothetical protein
MKRMQSLSRPEDVIRGSEVANDADIRITLRSFSIYLPRSFPVGNRHQLRSKLPCWQLLLPQISDVAPPSRDMITMMIGIWRCLGLAIAVKNVCMHNLFSTTYMELLHRLLRLCWQARSQKYVQGRAAAQSRLSR